MTDITIFGGGGLWLLAQATLLVLHYGNIVQNLPWWVVWFPSLIAVGCIIIAIAIFLLFIILSAVFS